MLIQKRSLHLRLLGLQCARGARQATLCSQPGGLSTRGVAIFRTCRANSSPVRYFAPVPATAISPELLSAKSECGSAQFSAASAIAPPLTHRAPDTPLRAAAP